MRQAIRILVLIVLVVLLLPYLLAPLYRIGHPVSTLMAWRWLTGAPVSRQWLDFAAISPLLPRSVVASEDAKFCSHHGIDWDALRDVVDDAEDGEVIRGGSTITQQVAKNLFLWPGRAWSARPWSFRSRCGSIWCCRSSGSWKSTSTLPNSGLQASSARRPAPSMLSTIRP
jgi:hypothetical protein